VIRLRVEPKGKRQDIRGWVGFDHIEMHRYPQLQLASDSMNGTVPRRFRTGDPRHRSGFE
jgi:hypothetical protein